MPNIITTISLQEYELLRTLLPYYIDGNEYLIIDGIFFKISEKTDRDCVISSCDVPDSFLKNPNKIEAYKTSGNVYVKMPIDILAFAFENKPGNE